MKNNDASILLFMVEENKMKCSCGKTMMQYMDTMLCPSCDQFQIRDLTWCKQHIEDGTKK